MWHQYAVPPQPRGHGMIFTIPVLLYQLLFVLILFIASLVRGRGRTRV